MDPLAKKRVVITGLGGVTPLGCDIEQVFDRLCSGRSGVGELTRIDPQRFVKRRAAEVKEFSAQPEAADVALQEHGQCVAYCAAAIRMCLADAGLPASLPVGNNVGVLIGTTMGNQDIVERIIDRYQLKQGDALPEGAQLLLPRFRPNDLCATLAERFGLEGPCMVLPTACAAGNYAVGFGHSLISAGRSTALLVGGADPFSRTCYTIFYRLGASTPDVCTPFAAERKGIVVGEGATVLMLEEREQALARGAHIYAEITGYSLTCDAHDPTAPHPEGRGAIQAMREALSMAGLRPDAIDYISAHGTGTPANDRCEAIAMAQVFGERLRNLPVSSIKSMVGHCMGAASALEAAVCCLALDRGVIPPTMNSVACDASFPIALDLVLEESRAMSLHHVMSNAFAFGGCVSSLILSRHGAQAGADRRGA